jgi:hypothetical protein
MEDSSTFGRIISIGRDILSVEKSFIFETCGKIFTLRIKAL